MPRIPTVPESRAGLLGRLAYRYTRRRFGEVPTPFTVLRHHPGLFWTSAITETLTERAVGRAGRLPAGLGELASHRVATRVACSFCVDFSAMMAGQDGVGVEHLLAAGRDDAADDPRFSELERLALAFADAATATPCAVTDELVAALDARLGHAGVVELAHLVALENMRARSNAALGIGSQGYCAVTPGAAGPSPG